MEINDLSSRGATRRNFYEDQMQLTAIMHLSGPWEGQEVGEGSIGTADSLKFERSFDVRHTFEADYIVIEESDDANTF